VRGEINIPRAPAERAATFAEVRSHVAEHPLRQRARPRIRGRREYLRIMLKTIPVILLRPGGW